jgi:mRNA degradation ribonuclease J1/J2
MSPRILVTFVTINILRIHSVYKVALQKQARNLLLVNLRQYYNLYRNTEVKQNVNFHSPTQLV